MAVKKIAFASIVFLCLMLQNGFCAWNQALIVSVADQNGVPVAGASVKITYQKANGITGNDGLAEGKTGEDGRYLATIANTVPVEMEDRRIKIAASAYDWQGEAKTVQAEDGSEAKKVQFTAPFTLGKMTIIVLQANGMPAPGASIYITGSEMKRTADAFGKAVIYLPEGAELSGFASYENGGDYFSTSAATTADDGSHELVVKFPGKGAGTAASGGTMLTVKFISTDGTALSGERVVFSHGGANVSAYTDAGGRVSIDVGMDREILASVKKNDYDYLFAFNVTADGSPKNETAMLAPLLKIDYFESVSDGSGCYRLSAKASDPRLNKPISVRMALVANGSEAASEIRTSLDENGMYTGRVCAGQGISVKVIASNIYETVEKTISLSQAGTPEPPPQINTSAPAPPPAILPPPVVETSPVEGLGAILVGVVLLALVFGAAALILGRQNPQAAGGMARYFTHTWGMMAGSTVRPIVEYLRSIFRKKEPPPLASFGQQPPQGPMMPTG